MREDAPVTKQANYAHVMILIMLASLFRQLCTVTCYLYCLVNCYECSRVLLVLSCSVIFVVLYRYLLLSCTLRFCSGVLHLFALVLCYFWLSRAALSLCYCSVGYVIRCVLLSFGFTECIHPTHQEHQKLYHHKTT